MGDLSAEPSMEEILSSIKRIIAEEGDGAPARARRAARPVAPTIAGAIDEVEVDEVLELSDPMPRAERGAPPPPPRVEAVAPVAEPQPVRAEPPAPPQAVPTDAIVSVEAAAASRGALDQLSRMMVRPEPGSDGSLEGLVREMLRPMLSAWLDANLPALVETMVAREIKRITGAAG